MRAVAESSAIRVGIVDYLNAWPLAWGFLTGALDDAYEPVYLPPAEVASELAAGRLDVGLIPSIEVQRQPDLAVVPGLCVAATHEVRSVILISHRPIAEVRRVALDRNSRTSAALVQILLRAGYGIEAEVEQAAPDAEAMLERADAALIIGDAALEIDRARYRVWDLASEWRELTGRPFVFAVWAVRGAAKGRASEITRLLTYSLELGTRDRQELVRRAVDELSLEQGEVRDYLGHNLSYCLDGEALLGLEEFYRQAAAFGLINRAQQLNFLGEPIRGAEIG